MSNHSVKSERRLRRSAEDRMLLAQARATVDRSIQKLRDTQALIDPHRLSPTLTRNTVSITDKGYGWQVLVEEEGLGIIVRTFKDRLLAFNFADSQVMRLGLDRIIRI